MKFPSERKFLYTSGAISNDAWTEVGVVNLVKDMSALNRRGYGATDNKGKPWCFRVKCDVYQTGLDGTGYTTIPPVDFLTSVKFGTVPNTWVHKNAAVKWHAARDKMWRRAGVLKRNLGAYAGAIRYNWDENATTFLTPYDYDGAAYAGGTWDTTVMGDGIDVEYTLKLLGSGTDEESETAVSALNMAYSYLSSRGTVLADSNLETGDTPAKFSHLVHLLSDPPVDGSTQVMDDIIEDARDSQDNPPYDEFVSDDTTNDITEPTEAARCIVMPGAPTASVLFDAPFGQFSVSAQHYDSADTNNTDSIAFGVEIVDIYPMQG